MVEKDLLERFQQADLETEEAARRAAHGFYHLLRYGEAPTPAQKVGTRRSERIILRADGRIERR